MGNLRLGCSSVWWHYGCGWRAGLPPSFKSRDDNHMPVRHGSVAKVFSATWQRCRVHFMRNALAHAGKSGRRVVSAFIAIAFAQETRKPPKLPKRSGAAPPTSSVPQRPNSRP